MGRGEEVSSSPALYPDTLTRSRTMKKSLRYLAFAGLAAVLVLALTESSANAQFRRGFPVAPVTPATANFMFANRTPITVPLLGTPGVGVNTNYYLNPYMTLN